MKRTDTLGARDVRRPGSALASVTANLIGIGLAIGANVAIALSAQPIAHRYPAISPSILEGLICAGLAALCALGWWRAERLATTASWLCLSLVIHMLWIGYESIRIAGMA